MDEDHGDVIVESVSAPFRPPAPRITQDLTPDQRFGWAVVADLARRRRSQLAALFALLMAVTVALAFAARPDPRAGADIDSSEEQSVGESDGLAASIPPMPDEQVDEGLVQVDGPSSPDADADADDLTSTSADETSATATTSATSATTTSASTSAPSATSAPTTGAPTTTEAPTTTTTAAPTTTEAPTTTFRSVNLLELSGFENPRIDERFAYVSGVAGWSASGDVELWVDGYNGVPAYAGRQFTELNARSAISISQKVTVTSGGVYTWTFAHRGRKDTDTVELTIDGDVIGRYSATPSGWTVRSGEVTIPEGQTTAVIALRAVDEGGNGNFIDTFRFYRTG